MLLVVNFKKNLISRCKAECVHEKYVARAQWMGGGRGVIKLVISGVLLHCWKLQENIIFG